MKNIIEGINFSKVKIKDSMWLNLIKLTQEVTTASNIEKCYSTGRIENFKIAGGLSVNKFIGRCYNDSDVYKILEGIGYSLSQIKNSDLEKKADKIIEYIVGAQEKTGYINTKYTILGKNKFSDMDEHEMYNGGHLIEAGMAYFLGTGKKDLLNVGIKFANHIMDIFGEGKRVWVPGHQEIEIALVKLGELLNEKKYIQFSKWLLDQRGNGFGSKGPNGGSQGWDKEYYQDTKPIGNLDQITGHAVRAMYMFTAMADVSKYLSTNYLTALEKLWKDICDKKMYITGGIGSSKENEGFTVAYDLPNDTAYCETCASVGMVFFNQKMFNFLEDSKYLDIVEKEIFNGVISGLSSDGTKFFYDNPLESFGNINRKEWFETSCCPTQLNRFIPSVANYIYARKEGILFINTFISNELKDGIEVFVESEFPNNGKLKIFGKKDEIIDEIRIRIPKWANTYFFVEKKGTQYSGIIDGFICFKIDKEFELEIIFEMKIDLIKSNNKIISNVGKVALQYGPTIYCLEEQDTEDYDNFQIENTDIFLINENFKPFNGKAIIEIFDKKTGEFRARLIPYYLWNNRKTGKMKVFIKQNLEKELYFT